MEATMSNNRGYVYILEVKDIMLPVCKIGMTTRTPYERCDEINKSSTGDFIWSVAYFIAVDDCKKLESLVHSKLLPLRQKGREFFNINADDANTALLSIFNSQTEIKLVEFEEIKSAPNTKKRNFMPVANKHDIESVELLQDFASLLNVKGRPFGQLNKPYFGMSDGNDGVQWNIAISKDTGIIRLGVNLEGMKYKDWPIAKFILSEIDNPRLFEIASKVSAPGNKFIHFSRDAWQAAARLSIVEEYLGGREISFTEIDKQQWLKTLIEARGCLNENNNYHGRAKQSVTLTNKPSNGEQVRIVDVSPHLKVWSPLMINGNVKDNLKIKMAELQPIYDWIKEVTEA